MLREYQIGNFKAFAGPESLPIKPITLIFGPNSSGKSSILQSLLLLKQTLADREDPLTPLLFKGDLVDLGSYRELIHRHEPARSFSFKVSMPMPASLDEPFNYHWIIGAYGGGFSELEESLKGFKTVALSISFSHAHDKPGTDVSQVQLFLGENPLPVLTYKQQISPSDNEPRVCRLAFESLNDKHEYWAHYWETFDRADDTYVRGLIDDAMLDPILRFRQIYDEKSLEEKDALRKRLIAALSLDVEAEATEMRTEAEPQHIHEFSQEEKDRLSNLKGFELALEAYKIQNKSDVLDLQNFLPERLNGLEMSDLIIERTSEAWHVSRSLSVLTLTAARLFSRCLKQTLYIGPLRNFPERYFMFSGVSAAYVGKTGKFVPDILVSDHQLLARVNEQLARFDIGYELKLSSLSDPTSQVQDLFALRLCEKTTGVHVGATDVGFGFSQVLPVIVQCLLSKQNMILIEQPELHLHPRLQAELADLFIDSALGDSKNTLIIETHSEHVLLRIMRRMRETSNGHLPDGLPGVTPNDVCIVFVQPREGSSSVIRHLELDAEGQLLDPWPGGFFEEGYYERFA